jgi:hypothetical protein
LLDGHIDKGVDALLGAVGNLESCPFAELGTAIDTAIAKVISASSEQFTKYVQMLTKLQTDTAELRKGFFHVAHEIEELAVRIDNAGN